MTIRFTARSGQRIHRHLAGAVPAVVLTIALAGCGAAATTRPTNQAAPTSLATMAASRDAPAQTATSGSPTPAAGATVAPRGSAQAGPQAALNSQAAGVDSQLQSIDNEIKATNSGLSGNEGTPGQ